MATAKGHLDQNRKNKHSTKTTKPSPFLQITTAPDDDPLADAFPTAEPQGLATQAIYVDLWDAATGKIFSDLTGRLPVPSSRGNNYIFLLYDYDSNSIHVRAIPSRHAHHILAAYQDIFNMLVTRGRRPLLHYMDNECSKMIVDFMKIEKTEYQKTPPGMHRINAAERAIRTFQNHFIATMCTTDKAFPLMLWDDTLNQMELTCNLLRGARLNPRLSAHEFLHGRFDYNATPLAPIGIRVLAYEGPDKRGTWSPHGLDAWYLGPAYEHYRCYRVWIWETKARTLHRHCRMVPTAPHQNASGF